MIKYAVASAALTALVLPAVPAGAQEAVSLMVSESEEYGPYLTDGNGRAVYLFTTDTQGQGGSGAEVSCEGECLDAWPPLYTQGDPQAGEGVDSSLLGTTEHEGQTMVTYNGWPLYYFVRDEGSGDTAGQNIEGFGGEWYLVSPDGQQVEGE